MTSYDFLISKENNGELGKLLTQCIGNLENRSEVISALQNYSLGNTHRKESELVSKALMMLYKLGGGSFDYFAKLYYIFREKNMDCAITTCNIMLKLLINKKMYNEARKYINNGYKDGNYNYLKGVVQCISGEYKEALESFRISKILSKRRVNNFEVITLMLLSDIFTLKNYNWTDIKKPYKELFECIKLGDIEQLEKVIQKNYNVFYNDNTLILTNRLFKNIIQEGIRKISIVYKKVSIEDMNMILRINAEPLLKKSIEQGIVNGRIEDGNFISADKNKEEIKLRTNDTFIINSKIKKIMKHKERKEITYENYVQEK
ncbi:26S proteasome regulatory subunit S3 [Spraguea lophii 42_110]|uniref:26S proteasome regulatory subunit S3 n=1 Tax=Spraguea lophii (strain 42_110) TaxID=1358809 RepID=S7WBS3_SPRLO|nr:26S proteasome regulatory subunit S3 [Spraguea lophii 42_110]